MDINGSTGEDTERCEEHFREILYHLNESFKFSKETFSRNLDFKSPMRAQKVRNMLLENEGGNFLCFM